MQGRSKLVDRFGKLVPSALMLDTLPDIALCRQCRNSIPLGASLCSHCNSYQDWRGHLALSGNVLALLVALISVATAAIPVLSKSLSTPVSKSLVTSPVFQGKKLTMAVTNIGDGPAMFVEAVLSCSFLSRGPVKLALERAGDGFIKVGSQPISLVVKWDRNADDALHLSSEMRKIQGNAGSGEVGFIEVSLVETDGQRRAFKFPISAYDVGNIADAQYEYCKDNGEAKGDRCSSSRGYTGDY